MTKAVKGGPDMDCYEYDLVTKRWLPEDNRLSYTQTYEFCIEMGWLDHLGILTPRGQRAVEEYEQFQSSE